MKTFYANFWREVRYNIGRKGVWIGRIANVSVSILTAFAMGVIYAFSSDAQNNLGIGNVGLFLLTGFFMQYLVLTSVTVAPNTFWADIRYGSLEFVFFCDFSITEYIFGMYSAQFLFDFIISIPFFIVLAVLAAVQSIAPIVILIFMAFVILSFLCLFSVSMLFSSLYALSKQFMGYSRVLFSIVYFICGVYFPVQGYLTLFNETGGWIAIAIVSIFPYTYVFDLARKIVFGASYETIYPLWLEFLLLFVTCAILYLLSLWIFRKGLAKLKKEGFAGYRY